MALADRLKAVDSAAVSQFGLDPKGNPQSALRQPRTPRLPLIIPRRNGVLLAAAALCSIVGPLITWRTFRAFDRDFGKSTGLQVAGGDAIIVLVVGIAAALIAAYLIKVERSRRLLAPLLAVFALIDISIGEYDGRQIHNETAVISAKVGHSGILTVEVGPGVWLVLLAGMLFIGAAIGLVQLRAQAIPPGQTDWPTLSIGIVAISTAAVAVAYSRANTTLDRGLASTAHLVAAAVAAFSVGVIAGARTIVQDRTSPRSHHRHSRAAGSTLATGAFAVLVFDQLGLWVVALIAVLYGYLFTFMVFQVARGLWRSDQSAGLTRAS